MSKRPHLVLDNYLPYLINRVGSAVAVARDGTLAVAAVVEAFPRVL